MIWASYALKTTRNYQQMSTHIPSSTQPTEAELVSLLLRYYAGTTDGTMGKRRGRKRTGGKPLKPTSIKMDEDLKGRLQRIAEREQRSMAGQIIYWVMEKIREEEEKSKAS